LTPGNKYHKKKRGVIQMADEYLTIKQSLMVKKVVKRSRFLAHVREVNNEAEAREFLQAIREEHRQATHNCFAFRVGLPPKEVTFSDDDGEPGGQCGEAYFRGYFA
jgi:putative IMPACT (imprinted ancient) family translation regulator